MPLIGGSSSSYGGRFSFYVVEISLQLSSRKTEGARIYLCSFLKKTRTQSGFVPSADDLREVFPVVISLSIREIALAVEMA